MTASTPRPFRFAVQSFTASSAAAWREKARKAEDLGYSAFHLADHYIGPGPALASTNHPVQELAAVPAIAAAAAATRSIRVGCRVFCVDYHHPVVLAKEAATLDFLSEGRLELGLGGGWLQAEYGSMGISFDPAPARIARLAELVSIVKAHFSGEPINHNGDTWKVQGFTGVPKPVQTPRPPIMIGGGSKLVLQLAAREADIISLNFNNRAGVIGPDGVRSSTAEATARKIRWVREAAGDRLASLDIEIAAYFTAVTDKREEAAAAMAANFGLTKDDILRYPHGCIGSVEQICDDLRSRREVYGINYVTVGDAQAEAFAPVVARLAGS